MNNLIRKFLLVIFCSPAIIIAFVVLIAAALLVYSFTFQYIDKFRLPDYAKNFPRKISKNHSWVDSISSYSIERRSKVENGFGEISTTYLIVPDCKSITGIEFEIDSNQEIANNSFEYHDIRRGLKIEDSLTSCEISENQFDKWKDRIRFLRDTLQVGKIWTNSNVQHFQFGTDIIIKKQQQSEYQCSDGIMFKEIQIDDEWKILRNCVTF